MFWWLLKCNGGNNTFRDLKMSPIWCCSNLKWTRPMWPVPPLVLCRGVTDVLNAKVAQKLGKSALEIHQGGQHFELSNKLPTELFVFPARSGHFCIYLWAAPSEPVSHRYEAARFWGSWISFQRRGTFFHMLLAHLHLQMFTAGVLRIKKNGSGIYQTKISDYVFEVFLVVGLLIFAHI